MPISMKADGEATMGLPTKVITALDEVRDRLAREHERGVATRALDAVIGTSDAIRRVVDQARRVLPTATTVLLEGPTGVGKELLARAIHDEGPRCARPFVALNCGGVPDELLASQLFGHRRGAFTGAIGDHKGVFEVADGGTLFLDEIGETSPAMQVHLLRALEEGEVTPVGACRPTRVDVRVIAASNCDLDAAVRAGTFRVDLLHRLRVFAIRVPPLAERPEDIPQLAEHLLSRIGERIGKRVRGFTPRAVLALRSHRYEGNVRELANLVERAIVLCPADGEIAPEHLFEGGTDGNGGASATTETLRDAVRAFACQRIAETLAACGGNKSAAARRLGLTYRGLLMKMQRYGMVPPAGHARD